MFSFFKKKKNDEVESKESFELELTAAVLAYEIARSDGEISESELEVLLKIAMNVGKTEQDILNIIEEYSKNSISFYEFIEDINKDFTKEDKLSLIKFLWDVAYADTILEVNEERLIRRIADLINIKDLEVLKLKDQSKSYNLD
jgi:uncharacterized tellurite resistance protein B-like protein